MTKSIATFSTTNLKVDNLTDAEIDALIDADRYNCVARGDSMYNTDVHSNLYGDDYADAMMMDILENIQY